MWRRQYNKKLIDETKMAPIKYYIRNQSIQQFGYIMRGNDDNIIKVFMPWKPTGKRPRVRSRKRQMDMVVEDLKRIGMNIMMEKYNS